MVTLTTLASLWGCEESIVVNAAHIMYMSRLREGGKLQTQIHLTGDCTVSVMESMSAITEKIARHTHTTALVQRGAE